MNGGECQFMDNKGMDSFSVILEVIVLFILSDKIDVSFFLLILNLTSAMIEKTPTLLQNWIIQHDQILHRCPAKNLF